MHRPLTAILCLLAAAGAWASPDCSRHRDDDLMSLACNLYFEAGHEGIEGMEAVAAVTLNRVASPHYPNTVREVVWQQERDRRTGALTPHFSWTLDGKPDRPRSRRAWRQARQVARRFAVSKEHRARICPTQTVQRMVGRPVTECRAYRNLVRLHIMLAKDMDPTGESTHYHADYVNPYWAVPGRVRATIGRHVFYAMYRVWL